jgi:hypothetical protein
VGSREEVGRNYEMIVKQKRWRRKQKIRKDDSNMDDDMK